MRILYVEDDPRQADITVRTLRKSAPHIQMETAATIHAALARLERIASDPLDLVLADMHLRDGDGLSLLQHIRENGLPLAVVLVTGMGDEETAVAALKARADDYVVKHKDYLHRLPVTLESALNHHRADAARRARPLKILYAEDELRDVESTRRHFAVHAEHLHLDAVFNGPEVLLALQSRDGGPRYDVLLMNFDLHELNALEVLRELRLTHHQDVPVVLLCREGDEELARQGLKLGASSYLVKSPGYLYQLPWELEEAHFRADLMRREAELRESEERRRLAQEAARVGTWEWDVRTGVSVWSEMIWQLLGLEPGDGETTVDRFTEFIHPADRDRVLHRVSEVMAEGEEYYDEFRIVRHDGTVLWLSSKGRVIRSEDGQPERILGVNIDITERKRVEEALSQTQELNRRIIDSSDDCIKVLDLEGRLLYLNPRGQKRLEICEINDYLHTVWLDFWEGEHRESAAQAVARAKAGERGSFRGYCPTALGTPKWWDVVITPITDPHGHVVQLLSVSRDITESKRAEEALRESEEQNRAILNAIPDLMFLQSRDGTYLDYHATDPDMLLSPPEQFLGKTMWDVLPARLASDFAECFEQAHASDKPVRLEYALQKPEGTRVYEASIVSCNGNKILSIVRDITERKEAEESLRRALAEVRQLKDRLHEENIYLQEEIRVASNFGEIIGRSEALRQVLHQAEQVAPTDTTVLILGETGTGKELLAHAIHNRSRRNKHTLVKVNCAALPAPLIESELFGHEKGAFTGASAQRRGRFELADGGTIFLDEVGELPLDLQAKLLRVLEQGEFERVGGSRTLSVDVRVIAATNRDLAEAMHNGTFRPDLYYRLSVYPLTVPSLRERREDIPVLVTHLVKQLSTKMGKVIETVPQSAMAALQNYHWPGNVRELRNVIERAVIITQGTKLQLSDSTEVQLPETAPHLPSTLFDSQLAEDPTAETLVQHESNLILRTLKRVNWKVEGPGGAAQVLNIHPSTLRTRMKKLGITKP